MDNGNHYTIELRRVNSEKALMRIEGLNEAESNKVFKNFTVPGTKVKGEYVKVIIYKDMVARKSEINP